MEAKFNLHIWGCLAKEGIYNHCLRKLDSRTTNGSFIGYSVNSKGFLYFIILHIILKLLIVKFLEDVEPSESVYPQKVLLKGNTRVD